ncbi:MAG: hypothetical protein JHD07_08850 [Bradyrhizobium sp.]|uniref:hypothetical protein n=1 Tax=Bradyrhizobium sp. TaxID=376 RepID=UPI001A1C4B0D|nr:hypothetical protein [Bradyrhizobium sp.]MBJ7403386.1 hypothetical protein [Bradyrhizobium sp.]
MEGSDKLQISRRVPWLVFIALLGVGIVIGHGSSPSKSEAPRGEPFTITENDMACLDKEFVRAAAERSLRWREQDGRVTLPYTRPFYDVNQDRFLDYDSNKTCIRVISFSPYGTEDDFVTLKVPAKVTIVERDGEIACVDGTPPKGKCYWMILRPPSERAGPKPSN